MNRERIDRALARVRERGFRIKTYGDIYRSRGYLAGDDATRADELMAAFADPETSAVWCARGGYGVVRLLDRIDFDVIRRNPKVFIGFSDITALHVAIQQRTGLITFHGPNLQDGFGKPDDMPAANEAALWRAVLADNRAANEYPYPFDLQGTGQATLKRVHGGAGTGRLTGGNLAVLAGMMGTPFEIETAGRILFLGRHQRATVSHRSLPVATSARRKVQFSRGRIAWQFFVRRRRSNGDQSEIAALCTEFFADLGVPVLAGFPAGHEKFNLTLPIGGLIKLDADAGQVTLLENCVAAG